MIMYSLRSLLVIVDLDSRLKEPSSEGRGVHQGSLIRNSKAIAIEGYGTGTQNEEKEGKEGVQFGERANKTYRESTSDRPYVASSSSSCISNIANLPAVSLRRPCFPY
jgi:hypothetical protein